MDQATVLPPCDTVWALGCPNIHPPLAQTRMESPMRRSSWTLARRGRWRSGGAVTVTTSAEAVGSSTGRLSHHRMMPGSVCDGLEIVRRPHNVGKLASNQGTTLSSPSAGWLRGVNKVVHSSFSSFLSV